MPRFHIHTLGCKVNRAESESIASALIDAGWEQSAPETADVAIVNTCTVTGEADHKNRKLIRSLLRAGSSAVIVTGCAVNVDADFYAGISPRVVCVTDKRAIPRTAHSLTAGTASSPSHFSHLTPVSRRLASDEDLGTSAQVMGKRRPEGFRTRVDLKIQDGCDNACTFCIVHTARGKARSASARDVVENVGRIAEGGTREVVLVGIDLAAYKSEGLDLAGLLELLMQETAIGRIRLSSVEPQSMTDGLIKVLSKSEGRICRHLHLCLQSGSSKVLREMARRYDADDFCALADRLHAEVPGIALSSDFIVGFPGETDEDFSQTCALIEHCGFMRLHVFRYSKRPGTPAAARGDQIAPQVMAHRAAKLRALGEKLALADMEKRVGTREQVIVERDGLGTSESYHRVIFSEDIPHGALASMEFVDVDPRQNALIARPL